MAVLENNKPQTEKTSASVTSTLPSLFPGTKHFLKDACSHIPKPRSLSSRSRSISNESGKRPGVLDPLKKDLKKSKLREVASSARIRKFLHTSLSLKSPRNYHGQIPVLRGHSLNILRMSPPGTRSPSPLSKATRKDKSSNKIKTITLDEDTNKKQRISNSRSPSPGKKASGNHNKTKSGGSISPVSTNRKNSEKTEGAKPGHSPKTPTKRKSKSKMVNSNSEVVPAKNKGKVLQKLDRDVNSLLKQASQPSLCTNEKIIQPQEKISLDQIKNELYSGEHRRVSLEKVHVCIEQNFNSAERKRSYLVTYSSEELEQNQDEISLSYLKNSRSVCEDIDKRKIANGKLGSEAIRTLSGHELILTPSMKLDIDKDSDCLEISEILSGETDAKKSVQLPQDDANEYDSEASTDGETGKKETKPSEQTKADYQNSLWKSREADLLNDVDYRQSVYHPTVSRRQNGGEVKPKSRSIENNYGYDNKSSKRLVRTLSSNLKNKYGSQCFDNTDSCSNERLWASTFDKSEEKPMYNSVLQDVPFYGMKRVRSKKERVSGAFLRFTLKIIRLLAIFNMWPGDNCYMLTSQSLRFAR